jgi:hypothetical protein
MSYTLEQKLRRLAYEKIKVSAKSKGYKLSLIPVKNLRLAGEMLLLEYHDEIVQAVSKALDDAVDESLTWSNKLEILTKDKFKEFI